MRFLKPYAFLFFVLGPGGGETSLAAQPPYGDPFAYCAAVGTMDEPETDTRYTGPEMPDSVIRAMIRRGIVTADAPREFQTNAIWRCMKGRVWVCHVGANIPCGEKADASTQPNEGMKAFCRTDPSSDIIPAYAAGRSTIYQWRCRAGKPERGRQIFQVDPRGYQTDFWYPLTPAR